MNLTKEDALHCAKVFYDYFSNFSRVDDYMRDQKLASLSDLPSSPLFPIEEDLFSDFSLHPNDMDFEVCEIPQETWETLLNITSSHINIAPVGRNVRLAVKEKNTQKFVGFLRLGSPVINCKPRNDMLGQVFSQQKDTATRFNNSTIMGFAIVPAQPFGYNYLGGKLLAGICCSHKIREICNKKYDMNLCLFETTSLYGNSKSVSQYDGMKPFVRYKGLTTSDFLPMMHCKPYDDLVYFVENRLGGDIVEPCISSRKLSITQKIIAMTKVALKNTSEGEHFEQVLQNAKNLIEKKRYYISDYGFSNTLDYVNNKTDNLIKGENYDKFELDNIVDWWKKKASNRFENLKADGRLRNELEVWTSGKHIDIIR